MKNKIIAMLISVVYITQGIAFAAIVDVEYNPSTNSSSVSKDDKIDVLNKITASIDTSKEVDKSSTNVGNPNQGSRGLSMAMGYLTPKKEFGYSYLDNYDYCNTHSSSCKTGWTGVVKTPYNDLKETFPSKGVLGSRVAAPTFYEGVKDFFLNNKKFRNSIDGLTVNDLPNLHIQTADDGRQFVSSAMYVRWLFDIKSGLTSGKYVKSEPILAQTSLRGGPYLAMGDNFSSEDFSGSIVQNNQNNYVAQMSSLLGRNFSSTLYLGKDMIMAAKNKGAISSNDMAMMSKKSEFRRYISYDGSNLENFEFVYPVEQTTVKSQNKQATPGLTNSVSVKLKYADSSNTTIDKYIFTVNTNIINPTYQYNNAEDSYTYNHKNGGADSSSNKEPRETQADKWHNVNSRTLKVKSISGETLYSQEIKDNASKKVVIEISPSDVGHKSLSGATVEVETNYNTNLRYMSKKEVVETNYAIGGKDSSDIRSYEEVTSYINDKANKDDNIVINTEKLTRYENTSNPRTTKTFKTTSKLNQKSTAKASIPFSNGGDPVAPKPTVTVDPPNALTKIEGGKFDINIAVDPNGVSIGDKGTDVWISDFKVQPVVVTAQNKEIIYRHDEPITNFSNENLNFSIKAVTANPSHIGKAIVEATYSYILNVREWEEREVEVDGKPVMEVVYLGTTKTHHSGKITGDFNIYSLSGVSV